MAGADIVAWQYPTLYVDDPYLLCVLVMLPPFKHGYHHVNSVASNGISFGYTSLSENTSALYSSPLRLSPPISPGLHLEHPLPSYTMSSASDLQRKAGDLTPVKQTTRISVIQGPSQPPLMNITLGELTRRQSQKHADRVAVISQHQNEEITYSQLHKYSDDLAAGMVALGTKPGDRVAVMLGNRSEYVHVRMSFYSTATSFD
jgi:AMP-binding enzyme